MNQELQAFIERQAGAFMPAAILVYDPQFELYLRAGKRVNYDKQIGAIPALCISRIEVNEDLIRTGVMTKLILTSSKKADPSGTANSKSRMPGRPTCRHGAKSTTSPGA